MEAIKLATAEQVERIRATSDLEPPYGVYVCNEDIAVIKTVTELDPVYFDEKSTTQRRLMFLWGLETWMRLNNLGCYYFNVPTDNEQWIKVVQTFGGEQVSKAPEWRYKKVLAK